MKSILRLHNEHLNDLAKALVLAIMAAGLSLPAKASGPGTNNSGTRTSPQSRPQIGPQNRPQIGPQNRPLPPRTDLNYGKVPSANSSTSQARAIGQLPPPQKSYIQKLPEPLQNQIRDPQAIRNLRPINYSRLPSSANASTNAGLAVQRFTVTDSRSPETRVVGAEVNGKILGTTNAGPRAKAPAGNDATRAAGPGPAPSAAFARAAMNNAGTPAQPVIDQSVLQNGLAGLRSTSSRLLPRADSRAPVLKK